MAKTSGESIVSISEVNVWEYLNDINNWLPKIDGYISHEEETERSVIVLISGRVGFITKQTRLKVDISERLSTTSLDFTLIGIDDPISGEGQLVTNVINSCSTSIKYLFEIEAHGIAAPVMNEVLERLVPNIIGQLAENISAHLEGREVVNSEISGNSSRRRLFAKSGSHFGNSEFKAFHKKFFGKRSFDLIVVGSGGAGLAARNTGADHLLAQRAPRQAGGGGVAVDCGI